MEAIAKPVLFSGVQPSGNLMIGNYIGALGNWVTLQDGYDCFYAIVDLHAITVRQDPADLRRRCLEFLCLYIACGIDPERSTVFIQSHVSNHTVLSWILNCYTSMGELSRMTQFKDKSAKHKANISAGLFDYPVLMAADILLYDTDLVPVGDDQRQHLELTRNIAKRFNGIYGNVFNIPEPYIAESGARIMSLQNPSVKMSKSDSNPYNYIALLDSPGIIREKIKRATTDSGKEIRQDPAKAGISNLLDIYSAITGEPISSIEKDYAGKGYRILKNDITDRIIEFLKPIQNRYQQLAEEHAYLDGILAQGAQNAYVKSKSVLKKVQDAIGMIPKRHR